MKQKDAVESRSRWIEKQPGEFPGNPFTRIGSGWMLISAVSGQGGGGEENWNTMTASWGGLGVLWSKPVAFIFVRPTRYTYAFLESARLFSLSFFEEKYRAALSFCGSHSGRNTDKAAAAGLTPIMFPDGTVSFEEAGEVLCCRKIYYDDVNSAHFLEPFIEHNYPEKDYHRMYIGEIISYRSRI